MAKYKGIIWSDARGKVNGVVYSRNTFGAYARSLTAPTQPRTPAQLNMRALLQNLARAWRDLTEAQREGWRALAAQVSYTDTLGNQYHPTGQDLYCGLNINLTLIGADTINNAPAAPVLVPTPATVTVTATGGGTPALTVAWTNGNANVDAIIFATSTLSKGRNFIAPSAFRIIGTKPGTGTPAVSVLSEWQAKYGSVPAAGSGKIAIGIKLVDPDTGFAGGMARGIDTW